MVLNGYVLTVSYMKTCAYLKPSSKSLKVNGKDSNDAKYWFIVILFTFKGYYIACIYCFNLWKLNILYDITNPYKR